MKEGRRQPLDEPGLPDEALRELIAEADTGRRQPAGWQGWVLTLLALAWSLFQLWYASPLPFLLDVGIFNDTEARSIHLAFAIALAFLAYPALKRSPRDHVPLFDWGLALAGMACAGYIAFFYRELSTRPGLPSPMDMTAAVVGLALLLEAARRSLGWPLTLLALIFLGYVFLGPYMPDAIAHRGASLAKGMSHFWLTTEGVFGVALGVSTSFIFLFVLFGAMLETAGAGGYFIAAAISLLGRFRGGPAKAAVVASASTGIISGSSIANVVTTGTFTIPLMKRVGYPPKKAAAVEVAASVDGQIMPPVMGAAAFLMTEYVGIPYIEVLKHAFLPAVLSYLGLFYLVHLEAVRHGIEGLPARTLTPWQQRLLRAVMAFAGIVILAGVVVWGLGWIKALWPQGSFFVVSVLMFFLYLALVRLAARMPPLPFDDPKAEITELPEARKTIPAGLHYLLPVAMLIWNLMVERLSPGLAAFWALTYLIFIILTQRPLYAFFRAEGCYGASLAEGLRDLWMAMVGGARNMVPIAIATASAGIIVGTVTLTGIGLVLTEVIEMLAGGNLLLLLLLVALICMILGMGLPTTANYIVVSTLMAPVVVEVGGQNGLVVPLIAVHMFVFYFGLMADVTPPVGLASYAAAGIARTDPIAVGVQAFVYSIRTAILPFMFLFNTQLLLIGVESWTGLVLTVAAGVTAMMAFVAAMQGWFFARNRWWEAGLLLLVAFTLLRPGFWMDRLVPPYTEVPAVELERVVTSLPAGASLRLFVEGVNLEGAEVRRGVILPLGEPSENARDRLRSVGIRVMPLGDRWQIVGVEFGSLAAKFGLEPGLSISHVELPNPDRPAKEWLYLPAWAAMLALMGWQRRRPQPSR
ncbi:TRAP transporter permease [Tepidiphilus olei]|uniref:TRAP transporter permease n=1 Tax=Tepidiphilus olei TaxID=2502184 RepID=UPI00115F35A5|nr:TRAP transporter permease [Tepidiphilus olei]